MGFGVSGATAIVVLAAVVATGVAVGTLTDAHETLTDAHRAEAERVLEQRNTAIAFAGGAYNATDETLSLEVTNVGSVPLSVPDVDLLVDNRVADPTATVTRADGNVTATDLLLPGETLTLRVESAEPPDRVTVAAPFGVRISAAVADLEAM